VKRVLVASILLAALGVVSPARSALCAPPRCIDVVVPVPAGLRVPDAHARVLLPNGYDPNGPGYPVLYLLHGAGDTYRTWSENTDVITAYASLPLIIVMPDGGRNSEAGWYSDWHDGSRQWETFHTKVLVDYIDHTFNTLGAGHRAVAGLSMGGFGAMHYAARHPCEFQAAAEFSGAVDTLYAWPLSGIVFKELNDRYGTPDQRVWGNVLLHRAIWRANNPTDLAAKLKGVSLFLASGTGTPGGPAGDDPSNPGGYAIEFYVFQMNLSFVRALTVAGVPFQQDLYAGGYHGWPYWQRELHWALPKMLPIIQSGSARCAA
jgi:diacylglycerol O-acyltransferase/trehalose O-mycolyltransferase